MSCIRVLPDNVSNKIAAGEVIERPASVVKELIENSLDAGAKKITVRIERAGQRLVSVADDGAGMDPDDAVLCFEQHATSKISGESDIMCIRSFGFRGEALPSIASVSRMTVRTRRRESMEGVEVIINGGVMNKCAPVGCAPGTEMLVRDLFFNLPARKKFLKSNSTEERHIIETVSVTALAHSDIAFELVMDGRRILSSAACDRIMPRITDIYGRELASAMLNLDYHANGISITGCIAKRGCSRPTRQEQRIFVNSRPVEAYPVYRGIREGCGPMLDKGRYQPAAIFIVMDPALVDVNVHPAKREVRFRNEFEVTAAVRYAVAAALKESGVPSGVRDTPVISVPYRPEEAAAAPEPEGGDRVEIVEVPVSDEFSQRMRQMNLIMGAARVDYMPSGVLKPAVSELDLFEPVSAAELPNQEPEPEKTGRSGFPRVEDLRIVGVLDDTYILALSAEGLLIIDQHAAHERVMYERILKGVDGSLSQRLLIPLTLELSRADHLFLSKNRELFQKVGFDVEPFGGNTVKINAIPAAMKQDNSGGVFRDLLDDVTENGLFTGRAELNTVARAACKAAVKAHDSLTEGEWVSLLRQLAECELPFCCPHGRPTIINLSVRELQRRFGRVR